MLHKERVSFLYPGRYSAPGTPPGHLESRASASPAPPRMAAIRYTAAELTEKNLKSIEEAWMEETSNEITWIDIEGVPGCDLLAALGEHYGFHDLALEDVLSGAQRSKIEDYKDYLFIVIYALLYQDNPSAHQVSIFIKDNTVITLEENGSKLLDPLRERLRHSVGTIRQSGSDYLAYSICDLLVDQFFPVVEKLSSRIDLIEDAITDRPNRSLAVEIHQLNREFFMLGHIAWDTREMLESAYQDAPGNMSSETHFHLRDINDHLIQIINMIETYRGIATSLLDVYLSSVSNQMNSVMKTLTIVATIFIPLTFIVGVYGMNFNTEAGPWNMPELNWAYGYPACWTVMLVIVAVMLWFMYRKDWL
ncbi:MAG: magnesium/cobalt transporter CorA [Deltaproteobacteria bacterium]